MLRALCRPLSLLSLIATCKAASPGAAGPVPDWWRRLEVRDLQGAAVTPEGRWLVVVFLSSECPVANAELPVLNALAAEFGSRGFGFVGAYADPALGLPALRRHAAEAALAFPAADDRAQRLARATGAAYTPEAFVFARDGALLYHGRIDDRVTELGAARPKAVHEDLREVLAALAAGRTGPFPAQPGFGCSIPDAVP